MKSILISIVISCVVVCLCSSVDAQSDNAGSSFVIRPTSDHITIKFAAEELSRYLSVMTGRDYPIVNTAQVN
ncbi:MAG: hypothetical protein ACYSSI_09080 [Planctomycetota bacterium]|jgi:hypothetical protein